MALSADGRAAGDGDGRWLRLFDGRTLEGWTAKVTGYDAGVNFADTFRVEDGLLKISYDGYDAFRGRFGHLFYQRPFSRYVLAAEYRFVGRQADGAPGFGFRNTGFMIHSQAVETMLRDQDFPISIAVQLLGGWPRPRLYRLLRLGGRPTANVCTPGTHIVMDGRLVTEHCVSSRARAFEGDGWTRLEVEVHGAERIVHRVNGREVLRYERPQIGGGTVHGFDPAVKRDGVLLRSGWIALKAESHPAEFRRIDLLELPG